MIPIQLEIDSRNFQVGSKTAIVMFSGGFDSTVALWWAMHRYKKVKAITVNYNQPWQQELDSMSNILELTDIEQSVVHVDIPEHFWVIKSHRTRWQPVLLCSIAALDVSDEGADIILGALKTDQFPDRNPEFLQLLSETILKYADRGAEIGITAPLCAVKDKTAVAVLGFQLGAPMHLSWSCRFPVGDEPCYECVTCKERYKIGDEIQSEYGISEDDLDSWLSVLGSPHHASFQNATLDLKDFAEAYGEIVKIKHGQHGWRYYAPDGTERITSLIKHPPQELVEKVGSASESMYIREYGFFEDETMWEVFICADGSVAATERIPDYDTIKDKLLKRFTE
ncbi:MAG: 7-cyano-7-deazaguanine synthase [Anaerolineae bacterium]|jgi:7-cyano-7-deazaguanine synthase|nr:7-cyano-7-deazaguanine synthase [Anaerolineae bacterium]MBT7326662.1 7-cyano-7-deazaguanine synthase [Anaerolineae bacterium]